MRAGQLALLPVVAAVGYVAGRRRGLRAAASPAPPDPDPGPPIPGVDRVPGVEADTPAEIPSAGWRQGAVVFMVVSVGLLAVLPVVLDEFGLGGIGRAAVGVLRWVGLVVFVIGALAVLYRFAPDRNDPRFSWVTLGAAVATLLWIRARPDSPSMWATSARTGRRTGRWPARWCCCSGSS